MKHRIKVIFPVPLNDQTRGMIESQIPQEFIRPEFSVEFVGSNRLMTLANSYYDMYIMESIVIEAGMKAEEQGFDAVCINTVSDSGMSALRARLNIPVINPGVVAYKLCELLLELGLSHSKKAYPAPEILQDDALFPEP